MFRRPLLAVALLIGSAALAATTVPTTDPTTLPIVTRAEWGSKPQLIDESRRQVPRLVTLHHAGELWTKGMDPIVSVRRLQAYGQREKHWPDLPYHYLIAPDGTIIEGRDWHFQPESNTRYELEGVLNIELFGNFEAQRVSVEQLRSTVRLIAYLRRDEHLPLDLDRIRGHKDAAEGQTVCPGKDFYRYIHDGEIRRWVEQAVGGATPEIALLPPLPDGPTTMIGDTRPASSPPATTAASK